MIFKIDGVEKETAVLLEIAYKSGYSFQMWFTEFEKEDNTWTWKTVWNDGTPCGEDGARPMLLGVDDIVSVIQLKLKFKE